MTTQYQQQLLDEAIDLWERGYNIPTDLYARLAQQGMDVPKLESIYKKGSAL